MKKLLLSTVAAFIFVTGAFAQQEMGWGLKAGVNFPNYRFSTANNATETSSTTNFHVTAFLDAPVATDWFYIQPGVSLQGKGAELTNNALTTVTQNTMWIEVPVNFVAKFPTGAGSFFLGAGPYVAFGISGNNKTEGNLVGGTTVQEFRFGRGETLKNTDFGLNFLAGYELGNGLMIHGGYGMGLTDIRGNNNQYFPDNRLTNRVWTVGLGFVI